MKMRLRSKLNEAIKKKGYQKQFIARQIGVTPTQISNWCKEDNPKKINPSLLSAMRLANILECKVEDLFELVEDD